MSLLDGSDAIVVYPSVWETDADGNYAWRPGHTPVLVWARVQPVSSTELVVNGQQVITLARVLARRAPAGPWDRIDYDGRTWDVLGEPETRGDSPATRHVTVLMQARGPHREVSHGRG